MFFLSFSIAATKQFQPYRKYWEAISEFQGRFRTCIALKKTRIFSIRGLPCASYIFLPNHILQYDNFLHNNVYRPLYNHCGPVERPFLVPLRSTGRLCAFISYLNSGIPK